MHLQSRQELGAGALPGLGSAPPLPDAAFGTRFVWEQVRRVSSQDPGSRIQDRDQLSRGRSG